VARDPWTAPWASTKVASLPKVDPLMCWRAVLGTCDPKYTIEGPIHIVALVAGASSSMASQANVQTTSERLRKLTGTGDGAAFRNLASFPRLLAISARTRWRAVNRKVEQTRS
jgi:hypothetical protein